MRSPAERAAQTIKQARKWVPYITEEQERTLLDLAVPMQLRRFKDRHSRGKKTLGRIQQFSRFKRRERRSR